MRQARTNVDNVGSENSTGDVAPRLDNPQTITCGGPAPEYVTPTYDAPQIIIH